MTFPSLSVVPRIGLYLVLIVMFCARVMAAAVLFAPIAVAQSLLPNKPQRACVKRQLGCAHERSPVALSTPTATILSPIPAKVTFHRYDNRWRQRGCSHPPWDSPVHFRNYPKD